MSTPSAPLPLAPFGLILPSRPVVIAPAIQSLLNTQFLCTFPSNPHFSHIVVFLLPGSVIPLNHGAAVYLQFPGSSAFKLLGALDNEKQSAIFKVNGFSDDATTNGTANAVVEIDMDALTDEYPTSTTNPPGNFILGISIEPAASIAAQLVNILTTSTDDTSMALTPARRPPTTKILAQRIIKNAFNFLASFAGGTGGSEMVPLKAFQEWWVKFERRVENDPGFLERDVD